MEQQDNIKVEPTSDEVLQGSGSILAEAREEQNKTIEEIAAELNLSVTQIKTIELDQTDGLPEPTYVRGYIRAYAKLLGLNPEEVLKRYLNKNWKNTSSLNEMPRGIANADEKKPFFLSWQKILTLLFIIAAFSFMHYSGMLNDLLGTKFNDQSTSSTPAVSTSGYSNDTQPEINESAQIVADQASLEQESLEPATVEQTTTTAETAPVVTAAPEAQDDSAVVETASEPTAATDATDQNEDAHKLLMTFNETSWVDIRDDKKERLIYTTYSPGEQLSLSSSTPMSVFLGNADGVTVVYNGQPFDLTEFREGVYAKFVLGDE